MEPRTMPRVTFECVDPACLTKLSVDTTWYRLSLEHDGRIDTKIAPQPLHHGLPMRLVQVVHADEGEQS